MNALGVVREVIERQGLSEAMFSLIVHPAAPGWRQRHRTTAQRIDHLRDDVVEGEQTTIALSGRELARSNLEDLNRRRRTSGDLLSICSRLEMAGEVRHLALMDLHPEEFIPYERLSAVVRSLCGGRSFRLLRTDRHHHVYGDFVMNEREWLRWNADFAMAVDLADAHYLGRSLRLGYNALRLNAGTEYQREVPVTVDGDAQAVRGPIADRAARLALGRQSTQMRRSGEPTVHHLREVAELAVAIYDRCDEYWKLTPSDVSAELLYACGFLHDSIEDSATDYEDIVQAAGPSVAQWVCQLSEDKRRPAGQRREAYVREIADASDAVQIVKLADLLSNLRGIRGSEPVSWMEEYLDVAEGQLGVLRGVLRQTEWFQEACGHLSRWKRWLGDDQGARPSGGAGQRSASFCTRSARIGTGPSSG